MCAQGCPGRSSALMRCRPPASAKMAGFWSLCCGSVRLWNVSHHQEVAVLAQPKEGGIPSATISADGSTFATADRRSRSIRIWKLAGSGEKLVLTGHEGGVPSLAFSPDGKVLASASKDRLVKLWDSASGRLLRTLPRFESSIQSVAFSPDGRLLATGQFGPTAQPVHIWDLATLQASRHPVTTWDRRPTVLLSAPTASSSPLVATA